MKNRRLLFSFIGITENQLFEENVWVSVNKLAANQFEL